MCVIDDQEIRGTMEQEVAEKEYQLKAKKKIPKSKAAPVPDALAPKAIEIDDDVWSIPSEDERVRPAGRANKVPKNSAEKDAATAARKAERQRSLAWRKETAKASKSIANLNSCYVSLKGVMDKSAKNANVLSVEMKKDLQEAEGKIRTLKLSHSSCQEETCFSGVTAIRLILDT